MTAVATTVDSDNPATSAKLETFALNTQAEIDAILDRAAAAQAAWAQRPFADRSALMHAAAGVLRANRARYALDVTREMGKPIVDAEAEIDKCALACDFYADHAEGFLADEPVASNAAESYIAYQPLGVVLAVMPWNFPFWQVIRFAAPALMAGNAGVLKHASNVSRCALDLEEVFRLAGFPAGAFATLIVPGAEVKHLIADPRIAAVTITGSEAAGVSVATESGRALKKHVLELGGSDAFIVLADADLPAAAKTAAKARYQNAGQSCICAKRFIVEDAVYDRFVDLFVAEAKAYVPGDPEDRATTMGPLARADLRDDLIAQIAGSVERGARIVLGGTAPDRPGAYFETTVLVDVDPSMPAFREETFGPVAALIRARDADHAIELANDSIFGLGGALWTGDVVRGKALARRIVSGAVFINGMTASDPRLPFGGVKHSGYGRELSYLGIREFMNIQTVWVGPAQTPPPSATE
jgi:succinate-semialdehyde dehydrogenase/glutarate-semialdehyde dehydrogenase